MVLFPKQPKYVQRDRENECLKKETKIHAGMKSCITLGCMSSILTLLSGSVIFMSIMVLL